VARILIWSPNYAPEPTGIPPLVTDAAEWLAKRGHYVDVVTAVPNYPERRIHPGYRGVLWRTERRGRVNVHRSWLRTGRETTLFDKALYEATISTFALPNAARLVPRADVIVCVVPTLLAATYAAVLARMCRKRLVLWVQDLVLAAGRSVVGPHGARVLEIAGALERSVIRSADQVVVCSPGFRDYFVEGGVDGGRIETLYNWADLHRIQPAEPKSDGRQRFLYAGNLGYTQGLETLIEAARIAGDGIAVEVVGTGNAAERIAVAAEQVSNVVVRPPVSEDDYPALLASADVHLVVQRRVSAGANLPSKIATSLASGKPIVASIGADTPADELLRASGAALLVAPESPVDLAGAMTDLAHDRERREQLGRCGRDYAERHLSKEVALSRFEQLVIG
jgi:colanic acid biosynthesis glycosyl transferase WcaI